jgi:GntR family transcriptional regulator
LEQRRIDMPKPTTAEWSPIWTLKRQPGTPLYLQVEEVLRGLIRLRPFENGELLPDEVTLAKELGVNLGTIRNSLSRLISEGILERKAGVGVLVIRRPVESGILAWRSFSGEMLKRGIQVQSLFLEASPSEAPNAAAAALRIQPGTPVLFLERVRGWADTPMQHALTWFHPRLGLSGNENFQEPLYDLLKAATGVDAERAHEEFEAIAATPEMAKRLLVKRSTPLLRRHQTTFDSAGNPIDYTEIRYRTDNFKLEMDLTRGPN